MTTFLPEPGVKEHIAQSCGGDIRKALNAVEFLYTATRPENSVVRRLPASVTMPFAI